MTLHWWKFSLASPQLPQPTPFQEVGVVNRDLDEGEVKKIERFVREV